MHNNIATFGIFFIVNRQFPFSQAAKSNVKIGFDFRCFAGAMNVWEVRCNGQEIQGTRGSGSALEICENKDYLC